MSVIEKRLSEVTVGTPQTHLNLTMFPLLAGGPEVPEYFLLEDALARGLARVTEVSESGSVPELKFLNNAEQPILLLDGEELVGAKQNRILNLTVLVPPKTELLIPVSCVEAGRWQHQSAEFSGAGRAHFAEGRAKKAARVSESMRSSGSRRSDQSEVWEDIAMKSGRMEVNSPTGAVAAMYESHRATLNAFREAFRPVSGQAGALFAISGKNIGLDLFDAPQTLGAVLSKLVESYALDAVDARQSAEVATAGNDPEAMLKDIAAAVTEPLKAVGEGDDLRLRGAQIAGGALVKDERVVHLCAFRMDADSEGAVPERGRMERTSRWGRTEI